MRDPAATTLTVSGEDWYGEDLDDREATAVLYRECDLTETRSSGGLTFTDCSFRGVRFNASEHSGAAFLNCHFANCTFFGATLTDCKFLGSQFERCTFDQLVATGGDWSFTGLAGADLRHVRFTGVRLREADLRGVRAAGAVLRDCDLSGAGLDRAELDRCDLRGSDLTALDPLTASVRGAVVDLRQAVTIASALGLDVRAD